MLISSRSLLVLVLQKHQETQQTGSWLMAFYLLWSPVSWCYPETKDMPKAVAALILSMLVADPGIFMGLEYRPSSLHLLFNHIIHAPITMMLSFPVTSLEWGRGVGLAPHLCSITLAGTLLFFLRLNCSLWIAEFETAKRAKPRRGEGNTT